MSGYLLIIIFMIILGGLIILSKFININLTKFLTGSLISSSSLLLLLTLVNRQLRIELYELGDLQKKLQESKQVLIPLEKEREKLENKIKAKETGFKQLESNIIDLRSEKFVIRSGQSLIISEISSSNIEDIKSKIETIIKNANRYTRKIVNPENKEITNLLLLRKNHIEDIQNTILKGGDWVINIKSVRNVLTGENFVYAFPEITENKIIVRKGEKITKIDFKQEEFTKISTIF